MNKGLKFLLVVIGCIIFGAFIGYIRDSYSVTTALIAVLVFAVVYKIVELIIKRRNGDSSV